MLDKSVVPESCLLGEIDAVNFESGAGTYDSRFSGQRGSPEEIWSKNFLYGIDQVHAPLRENCGNFVVIFLRDEVIESGFDLRQRGIERSLDGVVWMQMESGIH